MDSMTGISNTWATGTSRGTCVTPSIGAVATVGALALKPVDESASKIRDAVTLAEQLLEELHTNISHLESRLDTALTPTPPPPTNGACTQTPTPPSSHLVGRLAMLTDTIGAALGRLAHLRARVEV